MMEVSLIQVGERYRIIRDYCNKHECHECVYCNECKKLASITVRISDEDYKLLRRL